MRVTRNACIMRRKKVYMRVSALTTVNIPRDLAEQKDPM